MSTLGFYSGFRLKDSHCFSLSLSVVLFVIRRKKHRAEEQAKLLRKPTVNLASQTGELSVLIDLCLF